LEGEEGDVLADFGLEKGDIGGGDEEFVGQFAAARGDVDAVFADEIEFSGEADDHSSPRETTGISHG
jgi:hypothetical protein